MVTEAQSMSADIWSSSADACCKSRWVQPKNYLFEFNTRPWKRKLWHTIQTKVPLKSNGATAVQPSPSSSSRLKPSLVILVVPVVLS